MPHKTRLAVFKFASCDGCQLSLLDAAGGLEKKRAPYEAAYGELTALQAERDRLSGDETEFAQQLDMLRFQVAELREADVDGIDEDALELGLSFEELVNPPPKAAGPAKASGYKDRERRDLKRLIETSR